MSIVTLATKARQNSKTTEPDKLDGGQTKEKRYGYKVIDKPGRFMMIDKTALSVDHSYQRHEVYMQSIREMAKAWSWVACGSISVTRRDNEFMVTDGQRRTLAAMLLSSITELPCMVFEGGGVREEAERFLMANRNRKAVAAFDKYRAAVMTGDEIALSIKRALEKNGFELVSHAARPFTLSCIGTLEAKEKGTRGVVDDVLSAFRSAPFQFPVDAALFSAMVYLRTNLEGGIHGKEFLKRLSLIDNQLLDMNITRTRNLLGGSYHGYVVVSRALLDTLNTGHRNKLRLKDKA